MHGRDISSSIVFRRYKSVEDVSYWGTSIKVKSMLIGKHLIHYVVMYVGIKNNSELDTSPCLLYFTVSFILSEIHAFNFSILKGLRGLLDIFLKLWCVHPGIISHNFSLTITSATFCTSSLSFVVWAVASRRMFVSVSKWSATCDMKVTDLATRVVASLWNLLPYVLLLPWIAC